MIEVELRVRTVEDERCWLALVFVVPKIVKPILHDGTAVGRAYLLIRIGEHAMRDKICSIELVVPKIAGKRPRRDVGARLGDEVHLRANRPPCVASNRFATNSNSAIASRVKRDTPRRAVSQVAGAGDPCAR